MVGGAGIMELFHSSLWYQIFCCYIRVFYCINITYDVMVMVVVANVALILYFGNCGA